MIDDSNSELLKKLDEEANELAEFENQPYAEVFPRRDGLLWRTRAILAENEYRRLLKRHASLVEKHKELTFRMNGLEK